MRSWGILNFSLKFPIVCPSPIDTKGVALAGLLHEPKEFRLFSFDHAIAVFVARECSVTDILAIVAHRLGDHFSNIAQLLHEFRRECLELTDHVRDNQELTVTVQTSTYGQ